MALLAAVGLVAGCGGADGGARGVEEGRVTAKVFEESQPGIPADPGQWMVEIETDRDGGFAYATEEVVTPSGNTNFHLTNPQDVGHDLTIRELGGGFVKTPVVRRGSAWVRVSMLEGKRYVFYCSIADHRKKGMEGRITVDPGLKAEDLEAY